MLPRGCHFHPQPSGPQASHWLNPRDHCSGLCAPGPGDQSEVLSPCTEKLHPSVLGLRDREGTELALLSILGIKDKFMNVTESTGGQIKEKWFQALQGKSNHTPSRYKLSKKRKKKIK